MLANDPNLNEIYVRIIDEIVELWKPVSVKWVNPFQYEILHEDDNEILEFGKGDIVHGINILSNSDTCFIGAIRSYIGYKELDFNTIKKLRKNRKYII